MAKKTDEKATLQLVIEGKQAQATIKDVTVTMIGLERQLRNMKKADDPAAFKQMTQDLGKVRQAHSQMISEIKGGEGSLSRFRLTWKDIAAGFVGGNIATNALGLIKSEIGSLLPLNTQLSDSFADVAKDTGLSADGVRELNTELKELDTRTKTEELRELASVAGKFGVAKDQVDDFVVSLDKLDVAFGDQFGSAEELADTTLKLRNIFQDIKSDNIGDDILHIGNAMNVLEAAGAASGKGLADFSNRIGGVAIPLGLTTAQVLGLSAVLEELNVAPERGATAVNAILQKMLTDTKAFAKVAKMEVKDFEKLLNTDLMGAFTAFAKGAKEGGENATAFAKILSDAELSGSGASEVLLKLASNQDLLKDKVNLASNAISNASSVTNEFNIKNQNSGAVWEKITKKFENWRESMAEGLTPVIMLFGKWFGVVDQMQIKMNEFNTQQERTIEAETKLPKLISRYEELRRETNLTADQQIELQKIVQDIAAIVPGAVTEFDKYGNAMWINTGLTTDFIVEQRKLLETLRGSRKEELEHDKLMLNRKSANIQQTLKRGTIRDVDVETGGVTERKIRADEIKQLQKDLAQIESQKLSIVKSERELSGIAQKSASRGLRTTVAETKGNDNYNPGSTALTDDEKKKLLDDRKRLNDDLLKNQQELTLATLADHQKELLAAEYKYAELEKRAKGNASVLSEIEKQHTEEVTQINDKYNKKYLTDFDKTIRGQLNFLNNQQKEENKYAQDRADDAAKRADKELFEIVDHYDKEIALAKSRNESVVQLEKDKQAEIDKLNGTRATKQTDDLLTDIRNQYQSDLALADEAGTSKEELIVSHLERLRQLREEYGNLDLEQQKKINSEIAKDEKNLLALKLENFEKASQAAKAGSQVISDILTLASSNQSEFAEFQKAIGLFQIAVDTATAVAGAISSSTKGDGYTIALRIATAVAAVTAGMVKAKQLMAEAKEVQTPSYREDGGPTDLASIMQDNSGNPEGWVTRPTLFNLGRRSYVAGEKYKKEYVISNAMLQNPAVADFAGTLEALRQQRYFENGGSTGMSQPSTQVVSDPRVTQMVKLLEIIANKSNGQWNFNVFEEYRDLIEDTRKRASA